MQRVEMLRKDRARLGPLLAVLLGAVFALAVLELGLRVAGAAFLAGRDARSDSGQDQDDQIVILSLGESSTALGGPDSYPRQLERLLDERAGGQRVQVVNRAVPGIDSTVIVANLARDLAELRPEIVTVMMGISDVRPRPEVAAAAGGMPSMRPPSGPLGALRVVRLAHYLRGELARRAAASAEQAALDRELAALAARRPPEGASSEARAVHLLARGNLYHEHRRFDLERATFEEAAERFPSPATLWRLGRFYRDIGEHELAARVLYRLLDEHPTEYLAYQFLSWVLMAEGRTLQTEELLRRQARAIPGAQSLVDLGDFLLAQGRLDEAEQAFAEARAEEPGAGYPLRRLARVQQARGDAAQAERLLREALARCACGVARDELAELLRGQARDHEAERLLRQALAAAPGAWNDPAEFNKPRQPGRERALVRLVRLLQGQGRLAEADELLAAGPLNERTVANYRTLAATVKAAGARLVAVQYPTRSVELLRAMLPEDDAILVVDNEASFLAALSRRPYHELFYNNYAGDFGHCTAAGNALIAQNIAEALWPVVSEELRRRPAPGAGLPASGQKEAAAAASAHDIPGVGEGAGPPGPVGLLCPRCNLIVISLTNVRRDHLGLYGCGRPTSPNLDAFFGEGLVFDHAYSPASWSLPVAASLFTGTFPDRHGVMSRMDGSSLAAGALTLAEVLSALGYATAAFTGGGDYHRSFGLQQGFGLYVDEENRGELGIYRQRLRGGPRFSYGDMADLLPVMISWLRAQRGRPFFAYLQGYDAHCPFMPRPPWDRRFDPDYQGAVDFNACHWTTTAAPLTEHEGQRGYWVHAALGSVQGLQAQFLSERDVAHLVARYDGAIAQLDEDLALLLDVIRELGLERNTLILLTAEHGNMFGEHGRFNRGGPINGTFYDPVLRVPLAFRIPGLRASGRVEGLAQTVDLLPTLLELLGVPDPAAATRQGRSLRPLLSGAASEVNERVFAGLRFTGCGQALVDGRSVIQAVRDRHWKLILEQVYEEQRPLLRSQAAQLYRIDRDPHEREDLAGRHPAVEAALRAALERQFPGGFSAGWPPCAPR